uniref:Protein quiver n=1 Tax=Rhabditophanes sp. KR3021 TaxID=114890 RepID=A0AC35U2A4_9BILA
MISYLLKIVLIFLISINKVIFCIKCYNCTTPLPSTISADAQLSMKYLLYQTYNVPKMNRMCSFPSDADFPYYVPQTECPKGDACVKIVSKADELTFIMRGCQKYLLKKDVWLEAEQNCQSDKSPLICACLNKDLCNGVQKANLTPLTFLCFILFILFI